MLGITLAWLVAAPFPASARLITSSLVFTGGPYVLTSFLFPLRIGLPLWILSGGRVTLRGCWDDRYRVLALLVRSGFPARWTRRGEGGSAW